MKDILNRIKYNRLSEAELFLMDIFNRLEEIKYKQWNYYKIDNIPYFEYDNGALCYSENNIHVPLLDKIHRDKLHIILKDMFYEHFSVSDNECTIMKDSLFYCNIL